MKIAISINSLDMDDKMDMRFGRAKKFMIYDTETKTNELIDNTQNLNAAQGAGIQSAQNVINTGADAVITGHTGPKAYKLLSESGVKIYHSEEKPVKDVIADFIAGTLKEADSADVEGHWV
ncbi:MAG TPA: NifB/NifX family molybdenum-iron cluster-binding protein [Spirochaetota bacterium]|nr:NifB/NifX family molybdenum-iron cluster-binding protein [Spirochaetota bacterium]HOR44568.1 NifB/NifX family molybdenum-iron cluster-binding protein [Spirochaetota bacterium]HPK55983.1 NifB/NifX family molybdenum-iron cluster-binding protein [Spirochaetota bacterium]